MKRRQLPSASLTYIFAVPQVWSTGATAILTPWRKFGVEGIYVVDEEVGDAAESSVAGKRGDVQPNPVARHACSKDRARRCRRDGANSRRKPRWLQ